MRRLARRLFTLCSAVSLAFAVVWAVSYLRPLVLHFSRTPQDVWFLDASHGRVRLMMQRVAPATLNGLAVDARTLHTIIVRDATGGVVATSRDPARRDAKNPWWFDENAGGFSLELPGRGGGAAILRLGFVCVPLWFLVAAAALPALAARAIGSGVRGRRLRKGQCVSCGYDLRASPDRCPECGACPAPP